MKFEWIDVRILTTSSAPTLLFTFIFWFDSVFFFFYFFEMYGLLMQLNLLISYDELFPYRVVREKN